MKSMLEDRVNLIAAVIWCESVYYANENLKRMTDTVSGKYAEYVYDNMNRLIYEYNSIVGTETWLEYDAGGNIRIKDIRYLSNGSYETFVYEYDGVWKDQLSYIDYYYNDTYEDTLGFVYDGAGNPTIYNGGYMTWKNGRQLASYGSNTYDYDYNGIRTRKNNTYYFVEGSRILAEQTGDALTWYYYDESGVSGMKYNGTQYYFDKNILGDIVGIYKYDGTLIGTYAYDAWGVPATLAAGTGVTRTANSQIMNANPFRYRGYYYDGGYLYYLNSRYYNALIGRFISPDDPTMLFTESQTPGGANLYQYAYNNPIAFSDPTGHGFITVAIILAIVKAVVAGVAIGATISAGVELGSQLIDNGWDFGNLNWGQVGVAAVSGGVQGGIFALTGMVGNVWIAAGIGVLSGVAGNLTSQVGNGMLNGQSFGQAFGSVDWWQVAGSGAIGGLAGGLSFGLGTLANNLMKVGEKMARGAINAGMSEFNAVMAAASTMYLAQMLLPGVARAILNWLLV
jgi:RHS repeat-associated protein